MGVINYLKMDQLKRAAVSLKDRITKKPVERSVAEACSDENWGASNTLLHQIAEQTYNTEDRYLIMKLVWEYLKSPPKEWRRIYKTLNLIDHIVKFGSNSCITQIMDEAFRIRMLKDFTYREEGSERGNGVRDKAQHLSELLSDMKLIEEERQKAMELKNKFVGMGSNMPNNGRYSGFGSENFVRGSSYQAYDPFPQKKLTSERTDYYEEPKENPLKSEVPQKKQTGDIFKPITIKPKTEAPQKPAPKITPPSDDLLFSQPAQSNDDFVWVEPQKPEPKQPSIPFDMFEAPTNPAPQFPTAQSPNTQFQPPTNQSPALQFHVDQFQPPSNQFQAPGPQFQANQYQTPQFQANQYQTPQFQANQFQSPQFQANQFQSPQYQTPQYSQNPYQPGQLPSDLWSTQKAHSAPEPPKSTIKINADFRNTGPSMQEMKSNPNSAQAIQIESAPQQPKDLESKLFNFDTILDSNPKPNSRRPF